MPPPEDIDGLTPAKLKDLVLGLLEKVAALERTVAAQRPQRQLSWPVSDNYLGR